MLAWNGPLVTFLGLVLALLVGLLLVRLPLLDGVLFVGLAVVGVATAIEPMAGLAAALFLGLLRAYLRTEVPQVPAQIGQVFVALAVAVWLARGLARRKLCISHPPLLLPVLAFCGAALLSLWDAVELSAYGVPELIKWVQILVLLLFVSETLAEGGGDRRAESAGMETRPTGSAGGETRPTGSAGMETHPTELAGMETRPTGLAGGETRRAESVGMETRPTGSAGVEIRPTGRRLRWLLGVLLVTGLFQAGVGVWQFGLRGEGPDHFAILDDRFYRAYGTFEQPNPYAGYLGLTASLAVGIVAVMIQGRLVNWYIGRLGRRRPAGQSTHLPIYPYPDLPVYQVVLIGGVALAMLAALAMSWSRGAWLGFGAAAVAMALTLPHRARWGLLLVAVLVVGGLGLYATGLLPPSVVARLTGFGQYVRFEDVRGVGINDANYAVIERLAHWQAALEMFRHSPWTGVGFGCYEPAYADFALINWPIPLGHAHNYYLTVAAETGLIGLVAYLFLWGAVFWQTWRATRRTRGLLRGVAIGLLGTWTQLSVHHLLDNLYVNNVHLHVGVLLGVLAFVVRQASKSANGQICKSANGQISKSANLQMGKSANLQIGESAGRTNRPGDQVTR